MGAFFVRRNSNDPLYRRVLERYVHMATEAGVAQAMYPEGGLTRDGKLREPRLGLLDYALKSFDPKGGRDIVFVPVGINYDRVLEDRTQLRAGDPTAERRSGGYALRTTLRFLGRNLRQMLSGRWYRFGYACVNFGRPVSARAWLTRNAERFGGDLRPLAKEQRFEAVGLLARDLMDEIGQVVPVLPVSVVATVLLEAERPLDELELKARCLDLADALRAAGAQIYVPRDDRDYAIHVGLRMLRLRRLVGVSNDGLHAPVADEASVLRYYANAIAHLPRGAVRHDDDHHH
jgi:glycerol-3-phosphate O-acyltransferase